METHKERGRDLNENDTWRSHVWQSISIKGVTTNERYTPEKQQMGMELHR